MHLRQESFTLSLLETLVIDEADLILSYGHSADDIASILNGPWELPVVYRRFLMSATMTGEVEQLQGIVLRDPVCHFRFR
jgi:ATP-dependent RNA helicase DDX56/DBP9